MEQFAHLLMQMEEFQRLKGDLKARETPVAMVGLANVHKAHALFTLAHNIPQNLFVVTPDEASANRMAEDINSLAGQREAFVLPSRDLTLREVEGVSREYEFKRLGVLAQMAAGTAKIVLASGEAALQRTLPLQALRENTMTLAVGQAYDAKALTEFLLRSGYERRDQIEGACQFCVRGGILDVFPPNCDQPVRAEFWGDEIDTMAYFSLETQRRTDPVQEIALIPAREAIFSSREDLIHRLQEAGKPLRGKYAKLAREHLAQDVEKLQDQLTLLNIDKYLPLLYETPATAIDYLGEGDVLCLCEPIETREGLRNALWQHHEDLKLLLQEGILFKGCDTYYDDFTDLVRNMERHPSLVLDTFARSTADIPLRHLYQVEARQLSPWGGQFSVLKEELDAHLSQGYHCVILAGTEKAATALWHDLQEAGFRAELAKDVPAIRKGEVSVLTGGLSSGLEYPTLGLTVISHVKTAGAASRRRVHKPGKKLRSISDLNVGDYVVHVSYGIGVFEGIVKKDIHGIVKDYIQIRYAGKDTLFVPVTQLDLVSKYVGARDDGMVKLNKLNSLEWSKTRQRVKKAVADMADELIQLYAQRAQVKGFAFSPDTDWQNDFENRFPYEETEDQLRCTREIKADMEAPTPMDRLLCGDVGFGKTEVALRAVFKCVMDSKQCAVLVPTTILAWQHYQTFCQRMEGFPIRVELLSRFRTPKQQEQIIKDLKTGLVDVVIGTHRLLQKDVQFKDLGLCVIDEEQRFGVTHKERLKSLRNTVDVLTLSATPIPRTLNMAMSGIRDMSVIEEAPVDRHPVQTYVLEHDWGVVGEAMRRELRRGGQVFYLHNRIDTIDACAMRIREMLPDAHVVTAHGQMGEEQLSKVWQDLIEHKIDVLVCTTIIETGVDVPNCNTLIIEDADRMGLSQLYQLRGRVGRSSRRAFAYLTFTRGKALTDVASKRLSAVREFTSFGSGFRIAMRDLEIRGAGNILGAQQHGHMEAVGYEMYLKLLSDAIAERKGEASSTRCEECVVDLRIDAHIPESYISNLSQRIDIYKKIAAVATDEDAMDLYDELIDRFSDPPEAVRGLVEVSLIRNRAANLGIKEISERGDSILFEIDKVEIEKLSNLASSMRGRVLVNAGSKPYIKVKLSPKERTAQTINQVLSYLEAPGKQDLSAPTAQA